jgi:hypothetical protein
MPSLLHLVPRAESTQHTRTPHGVSSGWVGLAVSTVSTLAADLAACCFACFEEEEAGEERRGVGGRLLGRLTLL